MTLIIVWEPVLPTDIGPPSPETLQRINDPRAWQLWDPQHLLSDELRLGMTAHPSSIPVTVRRQQGQPSGILWDAVALFPLGARWAASLPAPSFLDGDVVEVVDELERRLRSAS